MYGYVHTSMYVYVYVCMCIILRGKSAITSSLNVLLLETTNQYEDTVWREAAGTAESAKGWLGGRMPHFLALARALALPLPAQSPPPQHLISDHDKRQLIERRHARRRAQPLLQPAGKRHHLFLLRPEKVENLCVSPRCCFCGQPQLAPARA